MIKFLLVSCALIGVCWSEAPLSGPYPASGWKPQGAAFNLPTKYGPPQQQTENVEVEITQENVEYAGQLGETSEATTGYPSNEYLPPSTPEEPPVEDSTDDILRVQGLPNLTAAPEFNPPAPQNGQLRQQSKKFRGNLINRQSQFQRPQQFGRQTLPRPDYGPPQQQFPADDDENVTPQNEEAEDEPLDEPQQDQPEQEGVDDESDEIGGPTVAVANSLSQGQYYILAPDNTLQRVMFVTTQTEDDRRANGFSAQLRYAPVEPIRDPIYAYNEQGQLVRIYNKK